MDKLDKISTALPTSLLRQVSVQNQFSVWFSDQNNKLVKVNLSSGNLTVSEAIN